MQTWLFALCLSTWLVGCADAPDLGEAADVTASEQAIIYGSDDRLEVYEHESAVLKGIAASAVVALVPRSRFLQTPAGEFAIFTRPLEQAFQVCADERFAAQPTAADCSGVLIDEDLVLTAGHCFASDDACAQFSFVFDYYYRAPGSLEPIGWGDVYGCRRIAHRSLSSLTAGTRVDYALVQLDRKAAGRTPVSIRRDALAQGEPLATVGSASGLPAKIDSGSHVLDVRAQQLDYFLLDSDTFAGSSGSGVFDAQGALVGVLVRGGADWVRRPGQDCMVPKVVRLPTDANVPRPDQGEEATYVARALDGLCGAGWPSERLCALATRCGDGFCSAGETRAVCPADCGCAGATCDQERAAKAAAPGAIAKRKSDGCGLGASSDGALAALASLALAALASRARRRRVRGS
ncbi:MAG: serine protease [Polyangiales bacterium]